MSGGGASPTLKKFGLVAFTGYGTARAVMAIIGGRLRLCKIKSNNPEDFKILLWVAVASNYFEKEVSEFDDPAFEQNAINLRDIYGTIECEIDNVNNVIKIGNDISVPKNQAPAITYDNIYAEYGFVEGVARITTPVGDAACVVKNGTLYPIITEYDQATEDNWTLQDVYLNGDNEVSNLQQMVDRSGTYLAYTEDQEADKWSPIENYLHMHVKMPIVPKIGYVPAQQVGLGNVLPGLNYAVTL